MKKLKYLISAAILSMLTPFALVSCSDEPNNGRKDESVGRTVLVYMVANNSLGQVGYDQMDIEEMKKASLAGDIKDGRLIVYYSDVKGDVTLNEVKDGELVTLKTYDNSALSVESSRMREVIADTKRFAPADDYGLILWSHGSGWLVDGIEEADPAAPSAQSFGEDGRKRMNVSTLARTLKGEDFGFIYFDCCLMGSIEVIYELQGCADYVVASPTELPVYGMPYNENIKYFFSHIPDLVKAAKTTFDSYNTPGVSLVNWCTMAVYDMKAVARLVDATKTVYSVSEIGFPDGYLPQRYSDEPVCYYYDFVDYVNALTVDKSLLDEFNAAASAVVIYHDETPMLFNVVKLEHCNGFATYIMRNHDDNRKNYKSTAWYRDVVSLLKPQN